MLQFYWSFVEVFQIWSTAVGYEAGGFRPITNGEMSWINNNKHSSHIIANEQPRKDARLQGGSLIEQCTIVPEAEKISNWCNM